MSKILEYILRHKRRFLYIIFILIIVMLTILILKHFNKIEIKNTQSIEQQEIYIASISLGNWCTVLTIFAAVVGGFWAMYQYDLNKELKQQERASSIAQDFADNIIEKLTLISNTLLPNQEIKKIISVLDKNPISQFTLQEALKIYDKQTLSRFEKIIHSKRTQKRYNKLLYLNYNKEEQKKFDSKFPLLVGNTLNQLEAHCISISSQVAGSQYIYESLHQMFLFTVEILYLQISSSNKNNVNKYYTNIISVYNMWNKLKNNELNKLKQTQKKVDHLKEKAEHEVTQLLNKQSKTVW